MGDSLIYSGNSATYITNTYPDPENSSETLCDYNLFSASYTLVDPGENSPDRPYYSVSSSQTGITGANVNNLTGSGSQTSYDQSTPTSCAIDQNLYTNQNGYTLGFYGSADGTISWPAFTPHPENQSLIFTAPAWIAGHRLIFSGGNTLESGHIIETFISHRGLSVTISKVAGLNLDDILFIEGTLNSHTFKGRWDTVAGEWQAFVSSNSVVPEDFAPTETPDFAPTTASFFGITSLYVNNGVTPWTFVGGTHNEDDSFTDNFSNGDQTLTIMGFGIGSNYATAEIKLLGTVFTGVYNTLSGEVQLNSHLVTAVRTAVYRGYPYFTPEQVFWVRATWPGTIQDRRYRFLFGMDSFDGTLHTDYYFRDGWLGAAMTISGETTASGAVHIFQETGDITTTISGGVFASSAISLQAPRPSVGPPAVRINGVVYTHSYKAVTHTSTDDYSHDHYLDPTRTNSVYISAAFGEGDPDTMGLIGNVAPGSFSGAVVRGKVVVQAFSNGLTEVTASLANADGLPFVPSYGPRAIKVNGTLWDYRGTWDDKDFYAAPAQPEGLWIDSAGNTSGTNPLADPPTSFDGGLFHRGAFSGLTDTVLPATPENTPLAPRFGPSNLYVNDSLVPWTFIGSSATHDYYANPEGDRWLVLNADGTATIVDEDGLVISSGSHRNGRFLGLPVTIQPDGPPFTSLAGDLDIFGNTLSLGSWSDNPLNAGVTVHYADYTVGPGSLGAAISFTAGRENTQWLWSRADSLNPGGTLPMMQLDNTGLTVKGRLQAHGDIDTHGVVRLWPAGDLPMDFTEGPQPLPKPQTEE